MPRCCCHTETPVQSTGAQRVFTTATFRQRAAAQSAVGIFLRVIRNRPRERLRWRSMILLYQLHWSHYVEKVRWALDFKGVEWQAVEVNPFSKREMRHLRCKTKLDDGRNEYTVPTIHDQAT